MNWVKKLGISLTIAFFALCCGAVLLFNWGSLGWKALSVPTGSMRPTINPGSLVLMHSVPLSSLKVGDVITYTNPLTMKTTITHRIIKTYKIDGKVPAFITKGDANPSPDQPVVGGLVQGKAIWHVPYVGAWLSWTKTWVGLAVLVYVPAILLMIEEVMRLNDYYRKSKPYISERILFMQRLLPKKTHHLAQATTISIALVAGSALIAFPAEALLRSNTVTLGPNHLSVAAVTPPSACTTNSNNTNVTVTGNGGSNSNNVNVTNTNNQSAHSGNASSSGNTNGGSATSGSASNTNCTTTTINITNH